MPEEKGESTVSRKRTSERSNGAGGLPNKVSAVEPMDTTTTNERPVFPQLSMRKTDDDEFETRLVPIPKNRYTPLKEQWLKILTPIVEQMKLQIRYNVKMKNVELRTCKDTTDMTALTKAAEFVRAFSLGFDVDDAIALLRLDELYLETFEIEDVKRLKGDHKSRAIGRIAGHNGRTKYSIENATKTRIVLAGNKVHLLGSFQNIASARRSICSLILGSPPSKSHFDILMHRFNNPMMGVVAQDFGIDKAWPIVEEGVERILSRKIINYKDYMKYVTAVHDFCTNTTKQTYNSFAHRPVKASQSIKPSEQYFVGQEMYTKLEEYINKYLENGLENYDAAQMSSEALLKKYVADYTNYQFSIRMINNICRYLNTHWINRNNLAGKSVMEVYDMGFHIWHKRVLMHLENFIVSSVLEIVGQQRKGIMTNASAIPKVTASFIDCGKAVPACERESVINNFEYLQIYRKHMESKLLDETRAFYTMESASLIKDNSICVYMRQCESRLKQEEERVSECFDPSTHEPMRGLMLEVLIEKHLPRFQSEFTELLDNERFEDLDRMYRLCKLLDEKGLQQLFKTLENYILKRGHELLSDDCEKLYNNPKAYIERLMEIYSRYNVVIEKSFRTPSGDCDKGFTTSFDKAYKQIVNDNPVTSHVPAGGKKQMHKTADLLARYIDGLLRRNAKSKELADDAEVERIIDRCIRLVLFLNEKDFFQNCYSNFLSKRLINDTSLSDDHERLMIQKLKENCGYEYIAKLERMYNDMEISRQLCELTSNWYNADNSTVSLPRNLSFGIKVLTQGQWPGSISSQVENQSFIPPKVITDIAGEFEKFYMNRHQGRRLSFNYRESKGELVLHSTPQKRLTCTTYQMALLFLFNDADELTFGDIQSKTMIIRQHLLQTLSVLVNFSLLTASESDVDKWDEKTVITYNGDVFVKKTRQMKVNLLVKIPADVNREVEIVKESTDRERDYVLQAKIVRIMKTRKKTNHNELLTEVFKQCNDFKPSTKMCKRVIDDLIGKEYIKRCEQKDNEYEYIQ